MAVTTEGYFVCDFCGDDHGSFNEKGNHVNCTEIAALRARLAECERVAEGMAMRLRLNKAIAGMKVKKIDSDLVFIKEDAEALTKYETYKSSHEVKK